ncbi:hypothetical protein CI238_02546, partial [Colletotrichum incanum]
LIDHCFSIVLIRPLRIAYSLPTRPGLAGRPSSTCHRPHRMRPRGVYARTDIQLHRAQQLRTCGSRYQRDVGTLALLGRLTDMWNVDWAGRAGYVLPCYVHSTTARVEAFSERAGVGLTPLATWQSERMSYYWTTGYRQVRVELCLAEC